jgi:hypothetical protein
MQRSQGRERHRDTHCSYYAMLVVCSKAVCATRNHRLLPARIDEP